MIVQIVPLNKLAFKIAILKSSIQLAPSIDF